MDRGRKKIIKIKTLDLISVVLGLIMFVEWILLSYYYWNNMFIRSLCFAVFGFTGLMICIYMSGKPPAWAAGRRKRLMLHRIKKSYLFARKNFMYAFFLTLFVSIAFGDPSEKNVREMEQQSSREEKVFYDKLTLREKTLASEKKLFKKSWKHWGKLSYRQKKEILERVIDVEATNLGLDYSVTLVIKDLEEQIEGRYRDYEIQLQKKIFETDSFLGLVENISHEMYHSFQQREIDALEKNILPASQEKNEKAQDTVLSDGDGGEKRQVVQQWKKEFENYQDGTEGEDALSEYYYQEVEITARAYSKQRVAAYKKVLRHKKHPVY